jgi:hypothetical protein
MMARKLEARKTERRIGSPGRGKKNRQRSVPMIRILGQARHVPLICLARWTKLPLPLAMSITNIQSYCTKSNVPNKAMLPPEKEMTTKWPLYEWWDTIRNKEKEARNASAYGKWDQPRRGKAEQRKRPNRRNKVVYDGFSIMVLWLRHLWAGQDPLQNKNRR